MKLITFSLLLDLITFELKEGNKHEAKNKKSLDLKGIKRDEYGAVN